MSATPITAPTTSDEIQEQAANLAAASTAQADAATAQVEADLAAEASRKAVIAEANAVFLKEQTAKAIGHLKVAETKDREAAKTALLAEAERLTVASIVVDLVDRCWATGEVDSKGRVKYDRKAYLTWATGKRPNGLGVSRTQADQLYSVGRFLPTVPANLRKRIGSLEAAQDARAMANSRGMDVLVDALKAAPNGATGQAVKAAVAKTVEAREAEALEAMTPNERKAAKAKATREANAAKRETATKHEQALVDLFAPKYAEALTKYAEAAAQVDPLQAAHTFAAFLLTVLDESAGEALRKCQASANGIGTLTS